MTKTWRKEKTPLSDISYFCETSPSSDFIHILNVLREGLSMARTDTRMFKGPLTGAASTTKEDVTGVSVCAIMKQGQWFNNSTFQKRNY